MSVQNPDYEAGIDYWRKQPASLDGVLGLFILRIMCREII